MIVGDSKLDKDLDTAINDVDIPTLDYSGEEGYEAAYEEFYKMVFEQVEALV